MGSPNDRRYTETHEWHQAEGDRVTIGLTRFAVDELTDITFVDITKVSGAIKAGESFGEIESVKATSELYCGVDGVIVAVNHEAIDTPAIINRDPFGRGWLIKVQTSDPSEVETLIPSADYDGLHAQ